MRRTPRTRGRAGGTHRTPGGPSRTSQLRIGTSARRAVDPVAPRPRGDR